jgi:phosphoribosylformylglycinamidine synthase PurS subunit
MTTRKARVYVTLKAEVLDPQGDAVRRALGTLGFADVHKVRVGKLIELELADEPGRNRKEELTAMCEKLLANPIIEDFTFELDETS